MDVYTYNPSTTALESIFRSARSDFPLFRSPSWASMASSTGAGFDNSSKRITMTSTRTPTRLPRTMRDSEVFSSPSSSPSSSMFDDDDDDQDDNDVRMAEQGGYDAEPEPFAASSEPKTAAGKKTRTPLRLRVPGPAPWTSKCLSAGTLALDLEYPFSSSSSSSQPRPTMTPPPEIKLAPRAQADASANSQLLDSYLTFLTGHTLAVSDLPSTMAAATAAATADDAPNPISELGLGEPPAVSFKTMAITGILCDIFGLDDLPSTVSQVSVLWLHNPRLIDRTRMHPIARRAVAEYNRSRPAASDARGLIAVAFDQRNHGGREVHRLANHSWKKGNPLHAQDMFGIISGTVVDTRLLIDTLPGYLFLEQDTWPEFDQHICLGVSLGGYSAWQTLFTDPRVTAGVSVIGCPDFQRLMKDRAALSKLATYDVSTAGASFLGSRDFPPALIAQCAKCDPKGIVFGTGEVIEAPATEAEQAPLRAILDRHVKGKKMLLCTGGLDKLVPWRCSESFTKFLCNAAETWYKDSGLRVDNRIYKRRAHEFSDEMVVDAVNFIVEVVNEGPVAAAAGAKVEARI